MFVIFLCILHNFQKLKTFQYIDPSQLPMEWEALEYTRKSVEAYEQLAETDSKYKVFWQPVVYFTTNFVLLQGWSHSRKIKNMFHL